MTLIYTKYQRAIIFYHVSNITASIRVINDIIRCILISDDNMLGSQRYSKFIFF